MSKHVKSTRPSDADLRGNPMIGGSKGTTAAGITPDDLDQLVGENTLEGDQANDVNSAGGVSKREARSSRPTDRA
jgi:hypothetical protein